MNIKKNIQEMVGGHYILAIESDEIYAYFETAELDLSPEQIDEFIEGIPTKTKNKWEKKLVKNTIKDYINNSEDYMIDARTDCLTWKNPEVKDRHLLYFCDGIIDLYKKVKKIKDPIVLSIVDTSLEHFIERTCLDPSGSYYEKSLDTLMNRYCDVEADEPLEGQLTAILEAQRSIKAAFKLIDKHEDIH